MTKTIRVTGESFEFPREIVSEAPEDSNISRDGLLYAAVADMHDYGNKFPTIRGRHELLEGLLRRGPDKARPDIWLNAAFYLSDTRNEPVVLAGGKSLSVHGGKDYDYVDGKNVYRDGTVMIRGSIGQLDVNLADTEVLAVRGDVRTLRPGAFLPSSGVIYVDGDVKDLKPYGKGMIIVSGDIGASEVNLKSPKGPVTPFLYTAQPFTVHHGAYSEEQTDSIVVDREAIAGWKPGEVRRRATALMRRTLSQRIEAYGKSVRSAEDITELHQFLDGLKQTGLRLF